MRRAGALTGRDMTVLAGTIARVDMIFLFLPGNNCFITNTEKTTVLYGRFATAPGLVCDRGREVWLVRGDRDVDGGSRERNGFVGFCCQRAERDFFLGYWEKGTNEWRWRRMHRGGGVGTKRVERGLGGTCHSGGRAARVTDRMAEGRPPKWELADS